MMARRNGRRIEDRVGYVMVNHVNYPIDVVVNEVELEAPFEDVINGDELRAVRDSLTPKGCYKYLLEDMPVVNVQKARNQPVDSYSTSLLQMIRHIALIDKEKAQVNFYGLKKKKKKNEQNTKKKEEIRAYGIVKKIGVSYKYHGYDVATIASRLDIPPVWVGKLLFEFYKYEEEEIDKIFSLKSVTDNWREMLNTPHRYGIKNPDHARVVVESFRSDDLPVLNAQTRSMAQAFQLEVQSQLQKLQLPSSLQKGSPHFKIGRNKFWVSGYEINWIYCSSTVAGLGGYGDQPCIVDTQLVSIARDLLKKEKCSGALVIRHGYSDEFLERFNRKVNVANNIQVVLLSYNSLRSIPSHW